ncbi:hypothetical protein V0M98_38810 (plasmid) [Pseudomonas silesiensis]|uniref:hypothetical protein n=1 Tax=Pseudomonas silesiensis TaxID=1853130 RepID=UPI0030D3C368
MKPFSHTTTDLKVVTSIAVGSRFMTIKLGDLPTAEFVNDDFVGAIKGIDDPVVLSTLFDFDRVGAWEIPLDEPGMIDSICSHFVEHELQELAELIESNKASILEMGIKKFSQHWDENLENMLYERAAKAGKIKHQRQEKQFQLVLRKAHPLRHQTAKHPLAKHFISNVWPDLHKEMRTADFEHS